MSVWVIKDIRSVTGDGGGGGGGFRVLGLQ
jgi:hypothetical protein